MGKLATKNSKFPSQTNRNEMKHTKIQLYTEFIRCVQQRMELQTAHTHTIVI